MVSFFFLFGVTKIWFLQVVFSEPIVITACEFLEQSASSVAQAVTLVGYAFVCLFSFFPFSFVHLFFYLIG